MFISHSAMTVITHNSQPMAADMQAFTFETTDNLLYAKYKCDPTKQATFGGTTATLVVQHRDVLHCAHVGDSRAVLCRWKDGRPLAEALTVVRSLHSINYLEM